MRKDKPNKWHLEKMCAAVLAFDKSDFMIKKVMIDNGGYFIIIKGTKPKEDLTLISIYAPDQGAPNV